MSIIQLDLDNFNINDPFSQNYDESTLVLTDNDNISNLYYSDAFFAYLDLDNSFIENPNEFWYGNFINDDNAFEIIIIQDNFFIIDDFQIQYEFIPSNGIS